MRLLRQSAGAQRLGRVMLGVALLFAVHWIGLRLATAFRLPLPGNVLGMLLLLALLSARVVPVRLFEEASGLLTRHLAFFFVPVAVGLMNLGSLFLQNGLSLLCVLVSSAAAGLCIAGSVSQGLLARKTPGRGATHDLRALEALS